MTKGTILRLSESAPGRPYHAALCRVNSRHTTGAYHTHQDFYELFYVLSGSGEHRLSTGRQSLRAGDLVVVRPTDCHYLAGLPPAGLEWINVAVPIPIWHGVLDIVGVAPASDINRARTPRLVRTSAEDSRRLESSFREALTRYTFTPSRLDLARFILDTLEVLARESDSTGGSPLPDWLMRACTAMNREENLRGGVHRLGELAGVSAAHLCRAMRAYYGMTPTAFVTGLRLRRAELLLATTSEPLTAIAYRCGFSSPSYFSRCFRQAQGTSPRDYRNRARHVALP